jgi:hypothetical protein
MRMLEQMIVDWLTRIKDGLRACGKTKIRIAMRLVNSPMAQLTSFIAIPRQSATAAFLHGRYIFPTTCAHTGVLCCIQNVPIFTPTNLVAEESTIHLMPGGGLNTTLSLRGQGAEGCPCSPCRPRARWQSTCSRTFSATPSQGVPCAWEEASPSASSDSESGQEAWAGTYFGLLEGRDGGGWS